jgi:cytochrome c oxidase subunit 2
MKDQKFIGYLFEVAWILPSVAIPLAMLVAIVLTAFAVGIRVPTAAGRVDPIAVMKGEDATFAEPGLRELAPQRYEAVIVAQTFQFTPNEITVPAGSRVTFILTSKDVIHGFRIEGVPINSMIVPGQISRVSATFDEPGEYLVLCHEYCGAGHHVMYGKVVVTESVD